MYLIMKFGNQDVKFECFDSEASKIHASNILLGQTYEHVAFVPDVNVIVDIGANVGATSVFLSLHYPNARIYSVEPQQVPFQLLIHNTQHNSNVKQFNFGLFNCDQRVPLYHSWVESGTASIGKSFLNTETSEEIELKEASSWLREEQIESIDILKIDTEGCEYQILSAIREKLPKISVIYIEYHSEEDRRLIDALLADSHTLYRAKVEKAHCGELTYVRSDLGAYSTELHKHRIKTNA